MHVLCNRKTNDMSLSLPLYKNQASMVEDKYNKYMANTSMHYMVLVVLLEGIS